MSFAGETAILPDGRLSHLNQTVGLISRAEGRLRRKFLRLVRDTNAIASLEDIADLLEVGDLNGALAVYDDIGPGIADTVNQVYTASGLNAAEWLRSQVDTVFDFNSLNTRAIQDLRTTRLRLVREWTETTRNAAQEFLEDAIGRGLSARDQARALKSSVGLTRRQAQATRNFRRLLEERSRQVFDRKLRDRRFDATVARAINDDVPLTRAQIDRMVDRYRQRQLANRALTIAETESLGAVGAGDEELFLQAEEAGVIPAGALVNIWRTTKRSNVRDSHRAMEGQKRDLGQTFETGLGNHARFPGDPSLPGEDRIRCKCVVQRKIDQEAMRAHRGGRLPVEISAVA